MKIIINAAASFLCAVLLVGCGPSKAESLKELKVAGGVVGVKSVLSSKLNFEIIRQVLSAGSGELGVKGVQIVMDNSNAVNPDISDSDLDEMYKRMETNKDANPELFNAVIELKEVASKIYRLAKDASGYSLLTYRAKALALKEEFDTKQERFDRHFK